MPTNATVDSQGSATVDFIVNEEPSFIVPYIRQIWKIAKSVLNLRNILFFLVLLSSILCTLIPMWDVEYQSFQKDLVFTGTEGLETRSAVIELRNKVAELRGSIEIIKMNMTRKANMTNTAFATLEKVNLKVQNLSESQSSLSGSLKALKEDMKSMKKENFSAYTDELSKTCSNSISSLDNDETIKKLKNDIEELQKKLKELNEVKGLAKKVKKLASSIHNYVAKVDSNVIAYMESKSLQNSEQIEANQIEQNNGKCYNQSFIENFIQNTVNEEVDSIFEKQYKDFDVQLKLCESKNQLQLETHKPIISDKKPPKVHTNNQIVPALDYALHSAGATIVHGLTSPTYFPKTKRLDMKFRNFFRSFDYLQSLANFVPTFSGEEIFDFLKLNKGVGKTLDAISHDMTLGSCWPMEGTSGQLVIRLAKPLYIDAISIDHIIQQEAIDVRSAPQKFEVYGLRFQNENILSWDEAGERLLLSGAYEIGSNISTQTFHNEENKEQMEAFQYVTLNILNNYGRKDYTCIYRFRVHGRLPSN